MDAHHSRHLNRSDRVNLGSFYTPREYVELVGQWLLHAGVGCATDVLLDPSCGSGAFLALLPQFPQCRFLANDIDREAIRGLQKDCPTAEIHNRNALLHVSRRAYGIRAGERLVVVGNPPYNDRTSQINRKTKSAAHANVDPALRTRDLGLSSLLAYDALQAEFVAILHPLSYLVKKTNFQAARRFFENYQLKEHLVFNSQEFDNTSRVAGFPVVVAFYQRTPNQGLTYDEVRKIPFRTKEGRLFALEERDYLGDYLDKYPHPGTPQSPGQLLFYTLRDVNALHRSKTFLTKRTANAVLVDPEKLDYYCYADCFKHYATPDYLLGNLDIPFLAKEFPAIAADVRAVAMANHPEVFGTQPKPSQEQLERVLAYLQKVTRLRLH